MRLLLALALALTCSPAGESYLEDFEDPALDGWERISSDGHPPYNTIELSGDIKDAVSGRQYLRMITQGRSTSLCRSFAQAWPVAADRPYRLSVFARLSGTRRNSASVSLIWLDAAGQRLSEVRAPALKSPHGWDRLVLDLPRIPAGAVAAAPRLDFSGDDVRGECDFDKLVLEPVELLNVRPAGRPYAIFTPEESPRFTATLAGAPAGTHGITFVLKSAAGAEVRRSAVLKTASDQPADVEFPALPPGAYDLAASVDGRSAERRLTVLVSPGNRSPVTDLRVWAGLPPEPPSVVPAPGDLAAVLHRRLADPSGPVVLDRLFIGLDGLPMPELLALRVTNDFLAGAVPLPDPKWFSSDLRTAAFRKGSGIALALWRDEGTLDVPVLLNPEAKVLSLHGSLRPLRSGERLNIGPLPTLVVGVDPLLLETPMALTGGDLTLQQAPATRTLRLHNSSKTRPMTDVRIRVEQAPPGWRVSPQAVSVPALAPDAEAGEDLVIALPPGETAGTRELRFELSFVRDGKEHVLHLSRPIQVRAALSIESTVTSGPKPGSALVTVRIRNASDRPMTLAMRARLPNLPEQNELLRELAPGALSRPFEYVVKDASLLDPTRASAEIDVQECLGDRVGARKIVPLR